MTWINNNRKKSIVILLIPVMYCSTIIYQFSVVWSNSSNLELFLRDNYFFDKVELSENKVTIRHYPLKFPYIREVLNYFSMPKHRKIIRHIFSQFNNINEIQISVMRLCGSPSVAPQIQGKHLYDPFSETYKREEFDENFNLIGYRTKWAFNNPEGFLYDLKEILWGNKNRDLYDAELRLCMNDQLVYEDY